MSVEITALSVARSVTARAVQLWLDGRRREQERSLDMDELVRLRIPGLRAQRSVERQFEQIADAMAARLEPVCAHEFRDLAGGDRQAAIDAVVDIFSHSDLSDDAIIGADADAVEWARRIRAQAQPDPALGESAIRFYELLLAECCDCYVRILRRLPVFTERAVTDLLARVSSLGAEVSQVLELLPRRSLYAPTGDDHDAEFEREYLGLISKELDEVELFSVLPGAAPRTILSVAYISLRASSDKDFASRHRSDAPAGLRAGVASWDEQDDEAASVRVETVLKRSPRLLLLGEAGSGKTTLLSWLAVTAARRGFTGDLAGWNDMVPFVVKLRSYAGRDLPALEGFLDGTASALAGHMPRAWVDRQFRARRALLMVDGVDELVAGERRKVRDWLRQLLLAYPGVQMIVTSRPTAADPSWLEAEDFATVSLQRMSPTDLRAFIRQWHQSVRAHGGDFPCAPDDLPHYERNLIADLQERPHLQALAANPLLAAMLCALHLNRRHLPRNRMELYQAALELLVERRDAERAIPSAGEVKLSMTDKLCVLRDLAWRLSDNNRHELSQDKAVEYVRAKVAVMRHLDTDGQHLFEYLLERSGVLRSPAEGRIDFVHRTFQEYLAAAEAAEEDRIGNLIGRAHLDQWRETIIMAAGHANRSQRIELITGILDRGEKERRHQRALRLLAASCLETMESVPEPIGQRLDRCVDSLLPPRRRSDAAPLALIGEPILDHLPRTLDSLSIAAATTTIRVAALVGGDKAASLLSGYAGDKRGVIREVIAHSWEYFDSQDYARQVLRMLPLDNIFLKLVHPSQWAALGDLPKVRRLWIKYPITSGLDPFVAPTALDWLWLTMGTSSNDLTPLRRQTKLTNLVILGGTVLEDPSPIAALSALTNLQIQGWGAIPRIDNIPIAPGLRTLGLGRLPRDTDLAQLKANAHVHHLVLEGTGKPRGLASIGAMTALTDLNLDGFDISQDLSVLATATPQVRYLELTGCKLPGDFGPINSMRELRTLTLGHCTSQEGPVDLASLANRAEQPILTIRLWADQAVRGKENLGPLIRLKGMPRFD